jgi:hypothetical protein
MIAAWFVAIEYRLQMAMRKRVRRPARMLVVDPCRPSLYNNICVDRLGGSTNAKLLTEGLRKAGLPE